jgi:signal recognition particle receptor subunit beta
MGAKLTKLNHSRWYSRNDRRVIIIGLDSSGKSEIARVLLDNWPDGCSNIEALSCYKLKIGDLNVSLYDLPGKKQDRFKWRHFFSVTQGIIFVVDMSSEERIQESREILHSLMNDVLLSSVPFLILCNKVDIGQPILSKQLPRELKIQNMKEITWKIYKTSAKYRFGVIEGFTWLLTKMSAIE